MKFPTLNNESEPARAKCNNCNCDFNWYIANAPFVANLVITGTCDDCMNGRKHVCGIDD